MSAIETLLKPGTLNVVFQPILELDDMRRPWGAEALTRGPHGTHFESAPVLFDYVRFKHEEVRVDRRCIDTAIARAAQMQVPRLSVNVHSATIERDTTFAAFLEASCRAHLFDPRKLIVELVEQSAYWSRTRLIGALEGIRSIGASIALDDVGLGHSNFGMILDVRADVLKVDRYFVDGCAIDPQRRAVLRAIAAVANEAGSAVIAEGIEREEDLATVREAGIHIGQGYLLGCPSTHLDFTEVDRKEAAARSERGF